MRAKIYRFIETSSKKDLIQLIMVRPLFQAVSKVSELFMLNGVEPSAKAFHCSELSASSYGYPQWIPKLLYQIKLFNSRFLNLLNLIQTVKNFWVSCIMCISSHREKWRKLESLYQYPAIITSIMLCQMERKTNFLTYDDGIILLGLNNHVKALPIYFQLFENRDVLCSELKRLFFSCERDIQSQKNSSMKKIDMRDYFSLKVYPFSNEEIFH